MWRLRSNYFVTLQQLRSSCLRRSSGSRPRTPSTSGAGGCLAAAKGVCGDGARDAGERVRRVLDRAALVLVVLVAAAKRADSCERSFMSRLRFCPRLGSLQVG